MGEGIAPFASQQEADAFGYIQTVAPSPQNNLLSVSPMAGLKSLLKDTAVYGMSSIVGRFLNYLLVPLYTTQMAAASGGYGVVTEVYAYTALLLVLLTFGMETTFFRFINKGEDDPQKVYSTILMGVGGVALTFVALLVLFLPFLARGLNYEAHPEYLLMMGVCVALDAFQAIPYAYLRYQKRPFKFAAFKLTFIVLNIGMNLVYFLVLPHFLEDFHYQVRDIFAMNLICTAATTLLFYYELKACIWVFDPALFRRLWHYAWPILLLGIAGILNQTADKMIFPRIVTGAEGQHQLGIYGACVKVAMIMAMITQAFRYAYEPFVFGNAKNEKSTEQYATAMKYFIIFTLFAFLTVIAYMDILKHLIGSDYHEGLRVTPIVMIAEILMGVYFNLSFWYKLIDKTIWGAWFSGAGCLVLIAVNVWGIPHYGYMACAWAGVAGYGTATVLSYVVGQRYQKVDYPLRSIFSYIGIAVVLYLLLKYVPVEWSLPLRLAVNTGFLLLFVLHFMVYEVWKKNPFHLLFSRF